MKRIESKSYRSTIQGLKLYLEDLEYIVDKLSKNDLTVVISDNENIYENLEELKEFRGKNPITFEICGKNNQKFMEYISVRLYNGSCALDVSSEDHKMSAYEIEKYISGKKRKRIYSFVNTSVALWQIFTNSVILLLFYFFSENIFATNFFIAVIIFWVLVLFYSEMTEDSNPRISFTRRHENNFYSKNKEKIYLSLFSLLFGAALTYIITVLNN